MRTTVLSDLHLGARSGADLLSRAAVRERLIERLEATDRLVLLGDVVELRERPGPEVIALAEPLFAALGSLDTDALAPETRAGLLEAFRGWRQQ